MGGGNKRRKHHDKDKYYKLAKEQGLRSRAAFKLSQINRRYNVLKADGSTKIVLDLCAAPGGWTQIASRLLPSRGSMVIAVDVLPIRPLRCPNVLTLVGDVTTDECRASIRRELQGASADVVLCDGAPDVGSAYEKDAYVQNEIALHCLRCATEHLRRRGDFVTKLYRSRDYASFVWVANQLFDTVEAVKPSSSRAQSAEIFLVCRGYRQPDALDPRLLDPRCVFEDADAAVIGDDEDGARKEKRLDASTNVFHKSFHEKRRQRQGYDTDKMDFLHRVLGTVGDFVACGTLNEAVHMLGEKTALRFDGEKDAFYRDHPATTDEIKICLSDLKVLNRSDFKGLLNWRLLVMEDAKKKRREEAAARDEEGEGEEGEKEEEDSSSSSSSVGSSDEESVVQKEIADLRQRRLREAKRKRKKERELKARRRLRRAAALDLGADDLRQGQDKLFDLRSLKRAEDLERAREVDLDAASAASSTSSSRRGGGPPSVASSQGEASDRDEETGYDYRLDRELDDAYDTWLGTTNRKENVSGTKSDKRRKTRDRAKEARRDDEGVEDDLAGADEDTRRYARMLAGDRVDDDDESDDDDGFRDAPETPEERAARRTNDETKTDTKPKTKRKDANPLIVRLPEEAASVKAARWFSNPLFDDIAKVADAAATSKRRNLDDDDDDMRVVAVGSDDDDDDRNARRKSTTRRGRDSEHDDDEKRAPTAEEILASIPRTDKQIRHERRLKALERAERRKKRKAKAAGEEEDFDVVAPEHDPSNEDDDDEDGPVRRTDEQRALLKAGMGAAPATTNDKKKNKDKDSSSFVVVPADADEPVLPRKDDRTYDSDEEEYDSDDRARTLALATMTLRRSKRRDLVDASYNRYAWNDPSDLPDWFVDDETRNYRPRIPIPEALLQKMRDRHMKLAARPIAKVAEARARKDRRAKTKLAAARKKAEAVATAGDAGGATMSEAAKLRAISKAMRRSGDDLRRPGRTYVVSKKNGSTKGGKGIKLVDKRMKQDARSMARATKKRSHGKQGGLTGSKKRRHHR